MTFTNNGAYRYTVPTCKFVNTGRVGLTLAARITLLVAVVEEFES